MKTCLKIIEEAYCKYIHVVGKEPEILIIHENALEKLKKETEEKVTVVIDSDIVTYRGATIQTSKTIHEDKFLFTKHIEN